MERTSGIQDVKCIGCGTMMKVKYVIDEKSNATTVDIICQDCSAKQTLTFRRHVDLK